MTKFKFFSLLLIIGGLIFTGYGVWQIVETNVKTNQTLADAQAAIRSAEDKELPPSGERYEPEVGDAVGILKIDRLKAELPIVEGTDPDDLEKGVGHYKGSYYPNENGQIVLSGHRDTVFRKAGDLENGDSLKILLPQGEFEYIIKSTKIVDADDTSIITLQNEREELILTTCYPFSFVGNAPERYIIYAEKVN
ncbi:MULTISPECIES: class D sortase [Bacillaceae]|uniref:class D sortase n=1 Tax=Bacillaceae TaxID=186817 RepID=UPI000C772F7C|nr:MULTISPECIES: class D sortase [Bacillaceae]PLR67599.1 class D sortase [Bacillus sp. UMB0893]QNG59894.1 class D sortase [Bacillus sp. PAMC26568]